MAVTRSLARRSTFSKRAAVRAVTLFVARKFAQCRFVVFVCDKQL